MEQVNAPARSYHQQMKRELPVTYCTECGGAGYNMRVANGQLFANPAANNAAAALTQLLSKHLIGASVHNVKQPDITAIKDAQIAKVRAIYSWD